METKNDLQHEIHNFFGLEEINAISGTNNEDIEYELKDRCILNLRVANIPKGRKRLVHKDIIIAMDKEQVVELIDFLLLTNNEAYGDYIVNIITGKEDL